MAGFNSQTMYSPYGTFSKVKIPSSFDSAVKIAVSSVNSVSLLLNKPNNAPVIFSPVSRSIFKPLIVP